MTDIVSGDIEAIVGVKRHAMWHLGQAVSNEQTIYILHSQDCLDYLDDLRDCAFSVALDTGVSPGFCLDIPVVLDVDPSKSYLMGTPYEYGYQD